MGKNVKNEHYVPVSYLKNFCGRDNQINVFDKFTGKRFRTNVTNVASEMYFYDTKNAQELNSPQQTVERSLSVFESASSKITSAFVEGLKDGKFLSEYRTPLAQIMAVTLLRTKEYRESLKEFLQKVGPEIVRETANEIFADDKSEIGRDLSLAIDEDYLPDLHLEFGLNDDIIEATAEIFKNHIWRIGVNRTEKTLYTSDHPVARMPHVRNGIEAEVGVGSPGIEIHFPLNSFFEIVMFERAYHEKHMRYDGTLMNLSLEQVQYSNQLQLIASYRFVFSDDPNFALARMWRELSPDQCTPEKARIKLRTET